MGANHSHDDLDDTSSDEEEEQNSQTENEEEEEDESYEDAYSEGSSGKNKLKTPSSIDSIESKLRSLKLKYPSKNNNPDNNFANAVRLYLHVGGNTPNSKWVDSDKRTTYSFEKSDEDSDDEGIERERGEKDWILKVGFKIKAKVSNDLQFKSFGEKMRVDFVANGVWAMRFFTKESYDFFIKKFQDCLFENMYGYENNDENKARVYGKDFMNWAKPEIADDSIWENAEEDFDFSSKSPSLVTPVRSKNDLIEEFEEASDSGGAIQSLALGALDNSFLVSQSGIQVVKNFSHGIHGKGVYVNFGNERGNVVNSTPKKAVLMRAETNMMLMSPMVSGKPHTRGLHQLDIETGKIVTEWKFEKDGTDITMRDITNDSKGSQMDPTGSTFLGLDDNRLCRWDMRDKNGIVQDLTGGDGPVLNWAHGHQFSRGTNFQCFASTGDGSIAVGSVDGKIRLYSNNSMRMAKTSFPGLGSPITHVDVTYDGKWILGTSDTYLVLICTMFADKDGKVKTGFSGRMGNKISAPRLLKLTPLDSHMAGVNNKFRRAQFSWVTENGKQERHLVATVGKFSVIWNFQQVKDGSHECYQNQVGLKSCYCYKIVLKHDSIVESRFMHEKFAVSDSPEAPLVVATPSKVSSFSISTRR